MLDIDPDEIWGQAKIFLILKAAAVKAHVNNNWKS